LTFGPVEAVGGFDGLMLLGEGSMRGGRGGWLTLSIRGMSTLTLGGFGGGMVTRTLAIDPHVV
jgi:hypothetical protein